MDERLGNIEGLLQAIKGNLEGEARAYHNVTLMLETRRMQNDGETPR
jgi:hypothetical protein